MFGGGLLQSRLASRKMFDADGLEVPQVRFRRRCRPPSSEKIILRNARQIADKIPAQEPNA